MLFSSTLTQVHELTHTCTPMYTQASERTTACEPAYRQTHTDRVWKRYKIDSHYRPVKVANRCFLKSNFTDSSILNEMYETDRAWTGRSTQKEMKTFSCSLVDTPLALLIFETVSMRPKTPPHANSPQAPVFVFRKHTYWVIFWWPPVDYVKLMSQNSKTCPDPFGAGERRPIGIKTCARVCMCVSSPLRFVKASSETLMG